LESEEELFHACLELSEAEQRALLARTCDGRPELRHRVEVLLAAHRRVERETLRPLADLVASPSLAREPRPSAAGVPGDAELDESPKFAAGRAEPVTSRRRPLGPVLLAALVLVSLLAIAGTSAWQLRTALTEKRRAEQVAELLSAMLRDVGPVGSPAHPTSVLDLLHGAVAQVDGRSDLDPEVRVELLTILGRAQHDRQGTVAAEATLTRAVDEATSGLGSEHPSTVRARVLLSSTLLTRGRTEGAAEEIAGLLPLLRGDPSTFGEELVIALRALAQLAIEENRYADAETVAGEGLENAIALLGRRHEATVAAALTMAHAAQHSRDPERALEATREAYRSAHDIYRASPRHPRVLEARFLYGRALCDVGQTEEGIGWMVGARDEAREAFGESSRLVGLFADELARRRLQRGEIDHALELSRQSLSIAEQHFASGSRRHAAALALRGEVLLAARRTAEALPVLERAVDALALSFGPGHAITGAARTNIALALAYDGQAERALTELEALAAADSSVTSHDDGRQLALGTVLRLAGRPADALRLLERWLDATPRRTGAERDVLRALTDLGLAQIELGLDDGATTSLLRALALDSKLFATSTPGRADVLAGLGRARLAQGRADEAVTLLEEADALWRERDDDSPWAAAAALWLGRCYRTLGREAEALSALARTSPSTADGALSRPGRGSDETTQVSGAGLKRARSL
jgi:tetratricopeptide (TPR) repeat protein